MGKLPHFLVAPPDCGGALSGQCYVDVPLEDISGTSIEFHDLLSEAAYVRDRNGLASKGLYFDIQPYGIHIFEVSSTT
jgi:hypothetical protein